MAKFRIFSWGDEIYLVVQTGYRVKGGVLFRTYGMPELTARVSLEENSDGSMEFRLGDIRLTET